MKKKILGLDLGVGSCGWALIEHDDNGNSIIKDAGSIIVPYTKNDITKFQQGDNTQTPNQERTIARGLRKQTDRFRRRKQSLIKRLYGYKIVEHTDFLNTFVTGQKNVWELRAKAVTEKISLLELGRVLVHLNQKRGYKQQRGVNNSIDTTDKKDGEYIQNINNNTKEIGDRTIGQYFYEIWKSWNEGNKQEPCPSYKNKIFLRKSHIEEFLSIMRQQQKHYEKILTDEVINNLQSLIFSQKPLKSQKHLVSLCPFESRTISHTRGKTIVCGPKVAPISSPIAEITRLWESINNIRIYSKVKSTNEIPLSDEEREKVFEVLHTGSYNKKNYLDKNNNLTNGKLLELLSINKKEYTSNLEKRKLKAHKIHIQILSCLSSLPEEDKTRILDLENIQEKYFVSLPGKALLSNHKTGEIICSLPKQELSDGIFLIQNKDNDNQFTGVPTYSVYYRLWHVLYSVVESPQQGDIRDTLHRILEKAPFSLPKNVIDKLIDEVSIPKGEFAGRSHKCMRKILPYLVQGYPWHEAAELAGYNHSNYRTKEENKNRPIQDHLQSLPKGSLRQPMVEKVLNNVVQLVNVIIERYGTFEKDDEIHIELARELKKSKEEKRLLSKINNENTRKNDAIAKMLQEQGIPITRKNILKYRLFIGDRKDQAQASCLYCGQPINIESIWDSEEVDVDHIIPQSLLFDDSQSNKVLVHRKCNQTKGNQTAFDFMRSKGEKSLETYCERVNELKTDGKISKTKYIRLMASYEDYCKHLEEKKTTKEESLLWENFINRQLRETQYISKKSKEMLDSICRNVVITEGGVTSYLRNLWGWNNILMDIQVGRYKDANLPTEKKIMNGHVINTIPQWTKRDDQRHHAIDALVVACTTRAMVQYLNTLSAKTTHDAMEEVIEKNRDNKKTKIENYLFLQKPFSTDEVKQAIGQILVKYKVDKKAYTISKQPNGNNKHITPRGPLHEDTLYGVRRITAPKGVKELFDCVEDIASPKVRRLIQKRLEDCGNNKDTAKRSLKKKPIYLDNIEQEELKEAFCYIKVVTKKMDINAEILNKKVKIEGIETDKILDKKVQQILQERKDKLGNDAFKNLEENPIWFNKEKGIPIERIRVIENIKVIPIGKDQRHVKLGNNHHIALYRDKMKKLHENVVPLMHAVDRARYGIPVFITNPERIWKEIIDQGREDLPQEFLKQLPPETWKFEEILQKGDMFVIGMDSDELKECIKQGKRKEVSDYLYRVQKLSSDDYTFRHHLETKIDGNDKEGIGIKHIRMSLSKWKELNPIKVKIDTLGDISMYD